MKYNQSNYRNIFKDIPDEMKELQASEEEASLSECIQQWLERTPGLEEDGFNFPKKFERVVDKIFNSEMDEIEVSDTDTLLSSFACFSKALCIWHILEGGKRGSTRVQSVSAEKEKGHVRLIV